MKINTKFLVEELEQKFYKCLFENYNYASTNFNFQFFQKIFIDKLFFFLENIFKKNYNVVTLSES